MAQGLVHEGLPELVGEVATEGDLVRRPFVPDTDVLQAEKTDTIGPRVDRDVQHRQDVLRNQIAVAISSNPRIRQRVACIDVECVLDDLELCGELLLDQGRS
ncbi:MAG TPA: hypothetical protein VL614_11170 [Acetobacteraceae bacterium]|nr:hypothetical protein [Acetobacteraceae bacterium]